MGHSFGRGPKQVVFELITDAADSAANRIRARPLKGYGYDVEREYLVRRGQSYRVLKMDRDIPRPGGTYQRDYTYVTMVPESNWLKRLDDARERLTAVGTEEAANALKVKQLAAEVRRSRKSVAAAARAKNEAQAVLRAVRAGKTLPKPKPRVVTPAQKVAAKRQEKIQRYYGKWEPDKDLPAIMDNDEILDELGELLVEKRITARLFDETGSGEFREALLSAEKRMVSRSVRLQTEYHKRTGLAWAWDQSLSASVIEKRVAARLASRWPTQARTVPKVKQPKIPAAQKQPLDITREKWTRIGSQKGSNPGGLYETREGGKWYVKWQDIDRAKNEQLSSVLYRMLNIDTPDIKLVRGPGGRIGTASRHRPGVSNIGSGIGKVAGARHGFVVDAWLANWDVVGMQYDNMLRTAAGRAVRIDPGGSLLYRAQGALKGNTPLGPRWGSCSPCCPPPWPLPDRRSSRGSRSRSCAGRPRSCCPCRTRRSGTW